MPVGLCWELKERECKKRERVRATKDGERKREREIRRERQTEREVIP